MNKLNLKANIQTNSRTDKVEKLYISAIDIPPANLIRRRSFLKVPEVMMKATI